MGDAFLRIGAVLRRTGFSRSMLYAEIARGTFPRQISLGARSVGWIESEVDDWIKSRIAAARSLGTDRVAALEPR